MLEVLLILQPCPSILVSPVHTLLWQLMKSAVDNFASTSSTLADLHLFDFCHQNSKDKGILPNIPGQGGSPGVLLTVRILLLWLTHYKKQSSSYITRYYD